MTIVLGLLLLALVVLVGFAGRQVRLALEDRLQERSEQRAEIARVRAKMRERFDTMTSIELSEAFARNEMSVDEYLRRVGIGRLSQRPGP